MDSQKSSSDSSGGRIRHEVVGGLLRVRVSGAIELTTVSAHVVRHQQIWAENSRVLWDLREADPSSVNSQDLLNIKHAFADVMSLRKGGRSAVLVSHDLDLVARLAIALSDGEKAPIALKTFLKEKDAVSWLNEV